jgi:predicted lipoprotein with Yx(FWY)xxD motif
VSLSSRSFSSHGRAERLGARCACASYWPPLLTHGKPVANGGADQSLIGTIKRADGSRQVTYAGHRLYTFVQDTKRGQTNGEGSTLFGAGRDALSPTGEKIEADGN